MYNGLRRLDLHDTTLVWPSNSVGRSSLTDPSSTRLEFPWLTVDLAARHIVWDASWMVWVT